MHRAATLLILAVPVIVQAQWSNDGPDGPGMIVGWSVDSGFTFTLWNAPASNNYQEMYQDSILPPEFTPDPYWRFQGYVVYQFRTPEDADDSVHLVVRDPDRAVAVVRADLADTITTLLDNLDPTGPDSCVATSIALANVGLAPVYANDVDPFTGGPYHTDSTYCFLALAFASNPWHHHPTCDTLQQIFYSRKTWTGALQAQCVSPSTVGIEELENDPIELFPNPAAGELQIQLQAGRPYRVRCWNNLGALVFDARLTNGSVIDVMSWPSGTYTLTAVDDEGRSCSRRLVIAR